jgi:hypothetical protein
MKFIKPLLPVLAVVVAGSAQAQTRNYYGRSYTPYPYGGPVTTTTTIQYPTVQPNIAGIIANQNLYGQSFPGTRTTTTITYGTTYPCPVPVPYPYPYPLYQYSAPAYSGPIGPPANGGSTPWITSIPLGSVTAGGYCPPTPVYGYPYGYGYAQPCPYPYPYATYPNGSVTYSQSNSGYGLRVGSNGVSVSVGGSNTQSTTTTSTIIR